MPEAGHPAASISNAPTASHNPSAECSDNDNTPPGRNSDSNEDAKSTATYTGQLSEEASLRCLYTNADGILNKRDDLENLAGEIKPHIICITETAPKNAQTPLVPSEIQLRGYSLHTNEGNPKRGVAIYVDEHLHGSTLETDVHFEESCWVKISLKDNDCLLIGCLYRSPNSNKANNDELLNMLKRICQDRHHKYSHLLICGDFNLPDIKWTNLPFTRCMDTAFPSRFLVCIDDCFLTQHVREATHHRPSQAANTLDLVLTNEENMVEGLQHCAPLGKSHHDIITFNFMCYHQKKETTRNQLNLNKGDYSQMREKMAGFTFTNLDDSTVNEAWDELYQAITQYSKECIPEIRFNPNAIKRPKWITETIREKIKQKNQAFRVSRKDHHNNKTKYNLYCKLRNQIRWETRKARGAYEAELAKEAKVNPKAIFKYVNTRLKTQQNIPDLETPSGPATSDKEKAEALNLFFTSVFTNESLPLPETPETRVLHPIPNIRFTPENVEKKTDKAEDRQKSRTGWAPPKDTEGDRKGAEWTSIRIVPKIAEFRGAARMLEER
jgi:hypothetical protein